MTDWSFVRQQDTVVTFTEVNKLRSVIVLVLNVNDNGSRTAHRRRFRIIDDHGEMILSLTLTVQWAACAYYSASAIYLKRVDRLDMKEGKGERVEVWPVTVFRLQGADERFGWFVLQNGKDKTPLEKFM